MKDKQLLSSILMLCGGAVLGIAAKLLDTLNVSNSDIWQRIVGTLETGDIFFGLPIYLLAGLAIAVFAPTALRAGINVFLFFAGLCASYQVYTVLVNGYDPAKYMVLWYQITILAPFIAYICWFARRKGKYSVALDVLILAIMAWCCFSMGLYYIALISIFNLVLFVICVIILHVDARRTALTVGLGILLAFIVKLIVLLL